ncbi:MAG: GNAT family N-acetyltransferase [Eubacterium sp.]|nr:GNAT family N-acetyltransferase [Eubacterium sp.]
MIFALSETRKAMPLFDGWQETMVWSCLQGVMGKIYVNHTKEPVSAMAVLGDFCFLAGEPDPELVLSHSNDQAFCIMVPKDSAWAGCIEACYQKRAKKVVRYAVKKEPDVFDTKLLQRIVDRLPGEYSLRMIDQALFRRFHKIGWCSDWVAQYEDYEKYQAYGMGAVILKDGEPVSGASSYSGYLGGIEVEIDTREDFRRKGLASVCGAKLILECLKRGWYPSWDAQNLWSLALAEKLGYHFDKEYTAYEVLEREKDETWNKKQIR